MSAHLGGVQADACHKRTGVEALVILARANIGDPYQAMAAATDGIRAGILHTTKMTVERVALRAEAFVIAGIEGTSQFDGAAATRGVYLKIYAGVFSTSKDKKTAMKVRAREMLSEDFRTYHSPQAVLYHDLTCCRYAMV